MLLQEVYKDDPWRLLVCCILLNQTPRRAVDKLLAEGFFERYPYPSSLAGADEAALAATLRSLGLQNVRARRLRSFSKMWTETLRTARKNGRRWPDAGYVAGLTGVGVYALDSYRFFVLGDTSRFESGDKELKVWLEGRTHA